MLGPFKIIAETKSPLAFVLDLPPSMSLLHPVFHVSLLEPVKPGHTQQPQDPPPIIEVEGEQEYTIDRILDSRIADDDGYDYLVHWKDFSSEHDSWEPWENIYDTAPYRAFYRKHRKDQKHVFPPRSRSSRSRTLKTTANQKQTSDSLVPVSDSIVSNSVVSSSPNPRRSLRLRASED